VDRGQVPGAWGEGRGNRGIWGRGNFDFFNELVWDGRAVERFDWGPAGGVGGGSTNHIDIHFLRSFIIDDRVSFY
jgi:hypothetical protein